MLQLVQKLGKKKLLLILLITIVFLIITYLISSKNKKEEASQSPSPRPTMEATASPTPGPGGYIPPIPGTTGTFIKNPNTAQISELITENFNKINSSNAKLINKEDLKIYFGDPKEISESGSFEKVELPSIDAQHLNHTAYLSNDNLVFLNQQHWTNQPNVTPQTLFSIYGNNFTPLYGPGQNSGTMLYASPSQGIAYLGHEINEQVWEIWYFEPTTLDNFLNTWGEKFDTKPSENPGF